MDRIEEWRAFASVARLHSFAKAAQQLGRSPQSITRAVAALESRLGTRLLNRTTRSVALTGEGEKYLARGALAVAQLDALEAPLDEAAELRGTLSVTAPVLFGQLHVLPVVEQFLAAHARVDVRLLLVDRVVSLVDEGVDVAIRIGALPDSSLRARRVGEVSTVCVASPAYLERHPAPRSIDALAKHAVIAVTGITPIVERWSFGGRSVAVRPRLVVNTAQAAIDACARGLGITRVLSYQVATLVARGDLRIVLASAEPSATHVQLLTLPGAPSRLASAFAEDAATALRARL